jgi:hypothetical protein
MPISRWLGTGTSLPASIAAHPICWSNPFRRSKPQTQRLFFADVAYRNPSAETLSCRRSQWVLYDKEGYSYDAEGNNNLFTPKERAPLGGERFITPGTRVRGWVAFIIPKSAQIERLQFLTGHLSTKIAEFLLGK